MKISKERLNIAKKKLISVEEYGKIKHENPYLYKLESESGRQLLFFGAKHSADPDEPQFIRIKESLESFNPDLVMVDAAPGPKVSREEFNNGILEQDLNEVIKRRGDPGFTIRVAVENDIPWFCPEPNPRKEFEFLFEKGFTKEEIQAWALFRNIPVFNKRRGDRTFDEFTETAINGFLDKSGWKLEASIDQIIKIGIEMIGEEVDVENDMNIHKYTNPGNKNKMQQLSSLSWRFRDEVILENIAEKLEDYNKLFVVYGSSHAVVLEPALSYLLLE